MSLIPIISLISSIRSTVTNQFLKNPDQPLSKGTKHYLQFLKELQQLLHAKEFENEVDKLPEAIHFVERVPIRGLFENQKLGKLLAEKNHDTLIKSNKIDLYSKSCAALPNRYQKMLMHIHHQLMKCYRLEHNNEIAWSFNYEFNQAKNKIWNDIIDAWQQGCMILSDSEAAYADYLRDYFIQGMNNITHTKTDIDGFIDHLVAVSHYSEEDKVTIKTWLKANGGQNNNRFIDLLLQGGLIEINRLGLATSPTGYISLDELLCPKYESFGLLKSESFGQGWFNKKGNICFVCDIAVYSLMNEKKNFIFVDPEKEKNQVADRLRMTNNADYFVPQQKNKHPLLRFQAEVRLNVKETAEHKKYVIPTMTFLKVTGYTHSVTTKYGMENVKELTPTPLSIKCRH